MEIDCSSRPAKTVEKNRTMESIDNLTFKPFMCLCFVKGEERIISDPCEVAARLEKVCFIYARKITIEWRQRQVRPLCCSFLPDVPL